MAEGQKSFWVSIGAGVVLGIAAAPFAYLFWSSETEQRAFIKSELADLNGKIARNNDTLAQLQKSAATKGIARELELLNARIESANKTLAGLQNTTTLDHVVKELGRIDAAIGTMSEAIKNNSDALAEIQKATMVTGSTSAAKRPALENSIADLARRIDDEKAEHTALTQDIARLQDALKAQSAQPPKAGPDTKNNDVVVFYVQSPDAMAKAQAASPIPPMTVRFEKIGSLDDKGQADMIVQKLKAITDGKSGCSVEVAGYADTLGDDKVNLAISKKRAHAVAAKLQAAFAGAPVQISEAAWGERRLQEWTANEVARGTNRRVDVSVNCKGE